MPFEQNRLRHLRTLRFRLAAWNAAVVLITSIVTSLGLREGVRYTLIRDLDQLLHEDGTEIELAIRNFHGAESRLLHDQLDRKDAGHAQHKWFVQLIDNANQVLYQSQHAPPELAVVQPPRDSPRTIGGWRYVDRQVDGITLRVGSSLELIQADIRRIDRLVVLAAGLVLLIALGCGYWLAGRATRPFQEMISTMAGLRPVKFNERLPIRGTGDELDRLSVTFNRLLDRIGNYLDQRRDFLANAAHELRTPLAAIRSSIEVALTKKRSGDEYESLLEEIIDASSILEKLVNQLLLLSETDAERLRGHEERVRLDQLVEKAIDMFGGFAEYREIDLTCSDLPPIEVAGNPQHLRQVIYNLVDNALKFTSAGGSVQVCLASESGQAVFSVRDTGIGVRAEDLPHVFDRFFRGAQPPSIGGVKGTGLGLSICQAIVRAHGGDISVESQLQQGTCFTVRLPLADETPDPKKSLTEPVLIAQE